MLSVTDLLDSASISQKVFEDYLENDKILHPYELELLVQFIEKSTSFALANLANDRFNRFYGKHNRVKRIRQRFFKVLKRKNNPPVYFESSERPICQPKIENNFLCYNILSAIFICAILTFIYFKFFL